MSEFLLDLDPMLEKLLNIEAKRLGITSEEYVVAEIAKALKLSDASIPLVDSSSDQP